MDKYTKHLVTIILILASFSVSYGQAKKVNTRKLINNYWSPSKGEYRVIQKRYFAKKDRVNLSLLGGMHINDPYSEGFAASVGLGYFFSESLGVELDYTQSFLEDSEPQEVLNRNSTGAASFAYGRTTNSFGARLIYSPIYAKMSLLGTNLIYFDLMFSIRLAMVNYEQITEDSEPTESSFSGGFGVHQLFYVTKNIAIRVDFLNDWYSSDVLGYQSGLKVESRTVNDTTLKAGVNFLF